MAVLVTGGAGFIGSHTCVELLRRGHDVVLADDYSNSSAAAVAAIREVSGRDLAVHQVDVRDTSELDQIFTQNPIDAVVHFAARKSVRESVDIPLDYYGTNVGGTTGLLTAMIEHGVSRLVNPVGAHPSGLLGEDPAGVPGNVLPYMMQVAVGRRECLEVYGDDYDTADGSGVRDYIHVMDVAEAHCIALDKLEGATGLQVLNLGTGAGVSVFQLIAAFGAVSGIRIPYRVTDRKPGDVGTLVADPGRAEKLWGWRTTRDLQAMCRDAWRFQRLHPRGYQGGE